MNELVTLGTYNDVEVTFIDNEKINLTEMWRASDGRNSQRPANWLALEGTQNFLKALEKKGSVGKIYIETQRGGTNPGTFAHWQLALAYAKYLSPEFHIWFNECPGELNERTAKIYV